MVKQVPAGGAVAGGGLFEDEDDEDDFFSGKSQKKPGKCGSIPANNRRGSGGTHHFDALVFKAQQEKVGAKKPIDLFADDDEDGDIFSEKYSTPAASKKEAEKEQPKQTEKKVNIHMWWNLMPPGLDDLTIHCCAQMPAGAISLFGPGTKSLLSEGLKKRRPSTSEESNKSEEV